MRARNILAKCSNAVIENNMFYNTHMASILAGPEFYWGEAPAVRNLVIRNNRFVNIDGSSINLGCHHSNKSYDNLDILIEGNTFENYGSLGGVGISGRQGTAVSRENGNKRFSLTRRSRHDTDPLINEQCSIYGSAALCLAGSTAPFKETTRPLVKASLTNAILPSRYPRGHSIPKYQCSRLSRLLWVHGR